MKLTEEEKAICKKYSARDEHGYVHCHDCPLVIDRCDALCKATCTKKEWENRENE